MEPDGSWHKEIIYPTKDAIIQELTGTTAEEAFSPAVLEPGGEEVDRAEDGGNVSQAGGDETTDFIEAEDVHVVPEAFHVDIVENAAKGQPKRISLKARTTKP
eukprot:GHVR01011676.1.p2 GENE.GHVR01011676.1~~GHVR01011676.1.p2  ORF type:complete len:103 (+),score=30.29 GHVR01011676.1:70-378(+)